MRVVMAHIQKSPVSPSRRTEQKIPPELDEVLMSCLRKDPNDRPQTMQELAKKLRAVPLENPWTEERARRWWLDRGTGASRLRRREKTKAESISSAVSSEAPLAANLR